MTHRIISIGPAKRTISLKEKEADFLRLCCLDIPYWKIARRMGKSPRTIDGYRDALFLKLRVRSRIGLILWCFKTGFVKIKEIRLAPRTK
jgi:DNA-binding CsgD family transcriptional regulator